jgi:hypothetical protein
LDLIVTGIGIEREELSNTGTKRKGQWQKFCSSFLCPIPFSIDAPLERGSLLSKHMPVVPVVVGQGP